MSCVDAGLLENGPHPARQSLRPLISSLVNPVMSPTAFVVMPFWSMAFAVSKAFFHHK